MPRFDGTGPQGKRPLSKCSFGREGIPAGYGEARGRGLGSRLRQRRRGQGCMGGFRLVGAGQDSGFVQACIERLQKDIQAMQERLNHLKAEAGK